MPRTHDMFRISLIMPCRNAAAWIQDALRSAAAQTHRPHEVIVIDDGSTDDSVERAVASGVPVRVLHTPGLNAAGARNVGIEAATGEWVAFLDADDAWYPEHLASAVSLLDGTGDVAYLGHCDVLEHDSGRQRAVPAYSVAGPTAGLGDRDFLRLWVERSHFPNSGVVARRDAVRAVGGFDVQLARRHDFELFLRLVHGRTWAYDPRPTWRYREGTPASISGNYTSCACYAMRAIRKNAAAYAGPVMDALLAKQARLAMSAAYLQGDEADRRRAWEVARPHLGLMRRTVYGLLSQAPSLYPRLYALARGRRRLLAGDAG